MALIHGGESVHYISKEPSFFDSFFTSLRIVRRKAHFIGWRWRQGGATGFDYRLDLIEEWTCLIYDLVGQVNAAAFPDELRRADQFVADLKNIGWDRRLHHLRAYCSHLLFLRDIGFRTAKEPIEYDLDFTEAAARYDAVQVAGKAEQKAQRKAQEELVRR